jgi:hypothetical protein
VLTIAWFRGAIALKDELAILPNEQGPLAPLRGVAGSRLNITKGPTTDANEEQRSYDGAYWSEFAGPVCTLPRVANDDSDA